MIMRGRSPQSPETIIVCARVHLACGRATGQRPAAAPRPRPASGDSRGQPGCLDGTGPPPAPPERRALLLGRRLSVGRLRRPRSVNQSCKACKHETRYRICNLVYAFLTGSFRLMPHRSSSIFEEGGCISHSRRGAHGCLRHMHEHVHHIILRQAACISPSSHVACSAQHRPLLRASRLRPHLPSPTLLVAQIPRLRVHPSPTCSSNPSLPRASLDSACIAQLSAPHASP